MQSTALSQNLSEDITTHPQGSYRRCQGDSTHEHEFTPVWTADCTLASLCKCGEKQECDIRQLQEFLRQYSSLKAEYLQERDKCSSIARSQEFAKAIAVKDRQITWLERQIKVLSLPNSSLSSTSTCSYLALGEIRRDGGTQPRSAIDLKHVKLLEEQIEEGKELEPVTVFYDGESYWLADGFHRWHAHRNSRKEAITCFIHQGSRRDAVLYSVGANADHKPALPRNREDKRRAVMTLLQDPEWGKWSDREIAQHCKVHHNTVGKIRASLTGDLSSNTSLQSLTGDLSSNTSLQSLTGDLSSEERTYKTKHGTVAKMKVANIGRKAPAPPDNLQDGDRVIVTSDHPLFPGQSGTITQLPSPDSAIVELDTGKRELINVRHLKPAYSTHLKLNEGELVEIYAPDNNKIDSRRGRIAAVHLHTVEVWLREVDTMTMQKHTLKHQHVTPLPLAKEPQLKEICDRLHRLRECSLDPFEAQILALLDQPVTFTPVELDYLVHIEKRYGIIQSK